MIKTCPVCGEQIKKKQGGAKYCSYDCKKQARLIRVREQYHQKLSKLEQKTCPHCGKKFFPKHRNQRYCSVECKDLAASARVKKTEGTYIPPNMCKWCDTRFAPDVVDQKYCCDDCRNDAERAKKASQKSRWNPRDAARAQKERAKIEAVARAQGASYGVYVAQTERRKNA